MQRIFSELQEQDSKKAAIRDVFTVLIIVAIGAVLAIIGVAPQPSSPERSMLAIAAGSTIGIIIAVSTNRYNIFVRIWSRLAYRLALLTGFIMLLMIMMQLGLISSFEVFVFGLSILLFGTLVRVVYALF